MISGGASSSVDEIQSKLEAIRRNKAMLEAKMREYERSTKAIR